MDELKSIWGKGLEFAVAFGQQINTKPALNLYLAKDDKVLLIEETMNACNKLANHSRSDSLRDLRIKLLVEEVAEYLKAELTNDLVEISDALTDIHYIATGTEIAYGIDGEKVFSHVHENNMSKLQSDGTVKYREDGKVLKPEGYKPPNVKGILYND